MTVKRSRGMPRRRENEAASVCRFSVPTARHRPCSPLCQIDCARPLTAKRTIDPFSRLKSTVYAVPERVIGGGSAPVAGIAKKTDIAASNGVIHVIDKVILPN